MPARSRPRRQLVPSANPKGKEGETRGRDRKDKNEERGEEEKFMVAGER
jgi:hypothetical protein